MKIITDEAYAELERVAPQFLTIDESVSGRLTTMLRGSSIELESYTGLARWALDLLSELVIIANPLLPQEIAFDEKLSEIFCAIFELGVQQTTVSMLIQQMHESDKENS